MRAHINQQIKKNPGQILGLTEACETTVAVSSAPSVPGDPKAPVRSLASRDAAQWLVMRGAAKNTALIAARKDVASKVACLKFLYKFEGTHKPNKIKKSNRAP